jgi:16S rRNA (cytosine967-C5)-methyltransferase
MPTPARRIAHEVLVRVEVGGAYADRALDAELQRAGALDPREAALATELVYGTLRRQIAIDHALVRFSDRSLEALEAPVRAALRLGAHQILNLRVPDHAAVSESVDLARARSQGREGSAGYVNAVLRALARGKDEVRPPDRAVDPIGHLAVVESHPRWLVERWSAWLGAEDTAALCRANNEPAPMALRVNRVRARRDEVAAALGGEAGRWAPDAVVLRDARPPDRLEGFAEGRLSVQDEAAQLVSLYAAPEPGFNVLDACAAPGGKACHLAEIMGDRGRVLAVDLHSRKAEQIAETAARLGLRAVETRAADLTRPLPGETEGAFDLVLLDAPCSGLGTLRRHPELKARRAPGDLAKLAALQASLLANSVRYVKPGGVLVYAVCTLSEEECDAQVGAFLAAHDELVPAPPPGGAAWRDLCDARGFLRTFPHRHGTDGFFAARLRRRGRIAG